MLPVSGAVEEQQEPGERGEDEVEQGVEVDKTNQTSKNEIKSRHVFPSFIKKVTTETTRYRHVCLLPNTGKLVPEQKQP